MMAANQEPTDRTSVFCAAASNHSGMISPRKAPPVTPDRVIEAPHESGILAISTETSGHMTALI